MNASMQATTAMQLQPAKIQLVALHVLVMMAISATESTVKVSLDYSLKILVH